MGSTLPAPAMLRSRIDRHRMLIFLLVAFGWTWAWDALYTALGWWDTVPVYLSGTPRQWGLPIAAVVVVWASDTPLRAWLARVFQWRYHPGLYLGVIFLPLFIDTVQGPLLAFGGGSVTYSPPAPLHLLFVFFLLNVFLMGGVEEFGWRGFLQPRFQERTSVLTAGLGVGVLWWAWHLPLFLVHSHFQLDPQFLVAYTTFILGQSVVLGALVNFTGGSVIPGVLMHASVNVGAILEGSGGLLDGVVPVSFLVGSGTWWVIVAVLVGLYGRSLVPGSVIKPVS